MRIGSPLLPPSPSLFLCFCVAWAVLHICYELVKLFPSHALVHWPCAGETHWPTLVSATLVAVLLLK